MQGQNAEVKIYRAAQLADDSAGGAQRGPYTVQFQGGKRARVFNRPATLEMRAQGLGTDRLYDAFYQPATDGIRPMDILIPQDGPYSNVRFLVTGVIGPSITNWARPEAHLKLQLERYDEGKVVDLQ